MCHNRFIGHISSSGDFMDDDARHKEREEHATRKRKKMQLMKVVTRI